MGRRFVARAFIHRRLRTARAGCQGERVFRERYDIEWQVAIGSQQREGSGRATQAWRRIEVVLSSLGNKLDRQSAKSVVQLQEKIRAYKPKKQGQGPLFDIYVDLHTILEELDELQRDAKWER